MPESTRNRKLDELELFTPQEAAEFLRVQPDTLRIWRRDRRGPSHTKVGGRVRYRRADLDTYLETRCVRVRSKK